MKYSRTRKNIVNVEHINGHKIPFYRLMTPDNHLMIVPRLVHRIYQEKPEGQADLKGWQIMFKRKGLKPYTRFFSDFDGTPQESLDRAIDDLRAFLMRTPAKGTVISAANTQDTSIDQHAAGVEGIRVMWRYIRRSAIWELGVDVVTGAGLSDADITTFRAGNEFKATEKKLSKAYVDALKHADKYTPENVQSIRIDLHRAYQLLDQQKSEMQAVREKQMRTKVAQFFESGRFPQAFRGQDIEWNAQAVKGVDVFIPDFIEADADGWRYAFRLADGSVKSGSLEYSGEPEEQIKAIVADCFAASMMSTPTPKTSNHRQKQAGVIPVPQVARQLQSSAV